MLYDPKWEVELDNQTVAVLKKAKDIISDQSRWGKMWYALDARGMYCFVDSDLAVRFCSIGAVALASETGPQDAEKGNACHFLERAALEKGFGAPQDLNDHSDHASVLAMFDRAIELASK